MTTIIEPGTGLRATTRKQKRESVPRHVRRMTVGWGGFMLAMTGVNTVLTVSGRSDLYVGFADTAYVELYRTAWETLVAPHPLPWMLALIAFEAAVGMATLRRGRARMTALAVATAFVLLLTPANAYTIGNPLIAAVPAYLLVRHLRAGDTW